MFAVAYASLYGPSACRPGVPHDYLIPFARLAEGLSTDGEAMSCLPREVIFYDQLGCGLSDRPENKEFYSVERSVEEFGAVMAAVGVNPDDTHLLG